MTLARFESTTSSICSRQSPPRPVVHRRRASKLRRARQHVSGTRPSTARKPSTDCRPASGPRRTLQRTSRTRPNFPRARRRRSTGANQSSEEHLNTPSLHVRARVEPINGHQHRVEAPRSSSAPHQPSGVRGTQHRTSDPPQNSEENFGGTSARIRAPENSGNERPTHRQDPKNLLRSHQLSSEHSVELFPGLRGSFEAPKSPSENLGFASGLRRDIQRTQPRVQIPRNHSARLRQLASGCRNTRLQIVGNPRLSSPGES
jgi:hypothetical protein